MADAERHPAGSQAGYVAVWGALLALTALTVTMASLNLGALAITAVLAIAAIKSTLVLLYFMHLRYETHLVIKLLIPITIATLAIFIGLTYMDVLHRY
jgi:cytochrome c oxidase subunit 4